MLKKLSIIAASIVALAFVFVSITHACSGLTSIIPAMQQSAMKMGASDSFPCGKAKPDICKSVRDSMLSVKPSMSGPEQTITPLQLSIESPFLLPPTPVTRVIEVSFHPVFKLPRSFLVLRI